ncbi:TAXI family TRAP transporter solute-binding subunit, partial [Leucobacter sp. M11]|uniref:TAXI family TRAP transporter solute-binding subunit n=1 Tax=Leucobacter sp. M11 TaxID=2993565 RepID=UPI002D80514F
GCGQPGTPREPESRVLGGERGGLFLEFAELFAAALVRGGVPGARAVATTGSQDNLARLTAGSGDFGAALIDSVQSHLAGSPGSVLAIGRVSQNYVHSVVRRGSPVRHLAELRGTRIGVGAPGSGTRLSTLRILAAAGLPEGDFEAVPLGLNDGLAALDTGEVEALFWIGGVPTPAVTALHARTPLRVLPLGELVRPLREEHGAFYDEAAIPAETYPGVPRTGTIGIGNLLVTRTDLPERLAHLAAETLLGDPGSLVPSGTESIQFLGLDALVQTGGVPLHPGAVSAYREAHG